MSVVVVAVCYTVAVGVDGEFLALAVGVVFHPLVFHIYDSEIAFLEHVFVAEGFGYHVFLV